MEVFDLHNETQEDSELQQSISDAMSLADLQEAIITIDMNSITSEEIEMLFAGYEENESAQRLKDCVILILKIRQNFSDNELLKEIFNLDPIGKVDVEMTPVSIRIGFHHLIDLAKVFMRNRGVVRSLLAFVPRGYSSCRSLSLNEEEVYAHIDYYRSIGITNPNAIKLHETRHSFNYNIDLSKWSKFEFSEEIEEREQKIQYTVDYVRDLQLYSLKNELSAFILADKHKLMLKHVIFRFGPYMGFYNFSGMSDDFWKYVEEHGSLSKADIRVIKKRIKEGMDIGNVVERSYQAVALLMDKGYSRSWAVSFFCTPENYLEDWLEIAKRCPDKN